MEDTFIKLETAKLARKIGFDEKCTKEYDKMGVIVSCHYSYVTNGDIDDYGVCTVCTQSQLQTWLRNKYQIHINPEPYLESAIPGDTDVTGYYVGPIYNRYGKEICGVEDSNYHSYEEALEKGLNSAMEFINYVK
jgi:hypothetical protein